MIAMTNLVVRERDNYKEIIFEFGTRYHAAAIRTDSSVPEVCLKLRELAHRIENDTNLQK